MNKRKIIFIIFVISILTITICSTVFAESGLGLGDLDNYKASGNGTVKFANKINPFITIMQVIGSLASVIVLLVVGIRYMLSSIEERAEYKKTFILYIIGCILVFSLTNIVTIIYNIGQSI